MSSLRERGVRPVEHQVVPARLGWERDQSAGPYGRTTLGDAVTAPDALCVCGHPMRAHEHLRRGTECAICGPDTCPRFRRRRWWRRG
jgi:hypothetical protein